MSEKEFIAGIDLGTTNSSIAVVIDGIPVLIPVDGKVLLPSVVGVDPDGKLLVGHAARNQLLLYPERSVRSIKRRMGEDCRITLGEQSHTPVEISAIILRRLKYAAEEYLGRQINKAVITVPAYFSDAQRSATKEAGEVAGFVVERIINEPTAAALCYITLSEPKDQTFLVYDLGGGTFDVSIVQNRGNVTEVLASHGDTALGGDDLDALLLGELKRLFESKHKVNVSDNLQAMVRLTRAAEEAKIALSTESYVQVIEENLYQKDGVGLHLDEEISRPQYEDLVESLLERTRRSIQVALKEAKLLLRDLDEILLVGGVTRTPKVGNLLRQELQKMPRQDIDPDTAIVMGAALQASRIMGESGRILVDVSPFSFGTSCIGEINDVLSQYRYEILIRRNTPLPARQTQIFYTMYHGQTACEVKAYQGEEIDARNNIFLGKFLIEGLDPKAPSGSEILCDFRLDLSGILQIEVTEKHTGLRKQLTIEDAFRKMSQEEIEASRNKIREMFNHEDSLFKYIKSDIESDEFDDFEQSNQILPKKAADGQHGASILKRFAPPIIDIKSLDPEQRGSWMKTISLLEKVERMYADINPSDQTEIDELANNILHVMYEQDFEQIHSLSNELADVLFYLE